ncbi:hypothetical protein SOV_22460 [Sporomusa ovata DSM 2662]|nr:hypothetical protein SOV_4c02250 [Sporomusa ovata DSM 2662]
MKYFEEFRCPCCGEKTVLERTAPVTVNVFNKSFLLRLWEDIKTFCKTTIFVVSLPFSVLCRLIGILKASNHERGLKYSRSKQ